MEGYAERRREREREGGGGGGVGIQGRERDVQTDEETDCATLHFLENLMLAEPMQ